MPVRNFHCGLLGGLIALAACSNTTPVPILAEPVLNKFDVTPNCSVHPELRRTHACEQSEHQCVDATGNSASCIPSVEECITAAGTACPPPIPRGEEDHGDGSSTGGGRDPGQDDGGTTDGGRDPGRGDGSTADGGRDPGRGDGNPTGGGGDPTPQ